MHKHTLIKGMIFLTSACCAGAYAEEAPHTESDSEPVTHKTSTATPETTSGVLAKPLTLGDTGITMQFGGFVQADLLQDFDPIGDTSQFKVNSIPVSSDPASDQGGQTNLQAKQTRFSMDVRSQDVGGRAYVEGDFFGSGNSFRIRHAYAEWRGFLAGQTWSTFQDISARPMTIDYEGPDSEIFVRQTMFRYTGSVSESVQWAIALEDPDSDISVTGGPGGSGRSEIPDIPANVRFTQDWGHVQVGALLRQLRFVSSDGSVKDTETGFGINVSSKAKLGNRNALMGHIAFGSGIGRYIESFGGTGSDAVQTADGLEALDAVAFVAGFEHKWSDRFASTISASYAELDDVAGVAGSAIKSATSMHANLIYTPNPLILLGAELMWGERENFDGDDGDAVRLQLSAKYKFR